MSAGPVRDAPWSAAWTGEQAFRLVPSADFPGLLELDQKEARGEGEPIFGALHATRLRRGLIDLTCHVCGKPTDRLDRYIFPVASGGLVTLRDGSQQYGCNLPPCTAPARSAPPTPARISPRCRSLHCGARATTAA